jgi:HEAT repeat protein
MASSFKQNFLKIIFCLYTPLLFSASTSHEHKKAKALEILELNKYTRESDKAHDELAMMKSQILYLFSKGAHVKGLKKYKEYYVLSKDHDYTLLREMSLMIVENGISKGTEIDSLLSLIAMEIAGEDNFSHHLSKLIHSNYFPVQAKTLSLLRRIDNEYSDQLIKSCLSSNFIMLRLEALSILVQKHHNTAIGQVEALMNMVHKAYHPVFVDFYALSGTKYAISVLKKMMSDSDLNLGLATIIAAKNYRIEELIPNLRNSLTHTSSIIQESAANTLGAFHDSHAISKLEATLKSKHEETRLSALFALYNMGQKKRKDEIIQLAKKGNLFAISILPKIEGSEKTLHEIYYSDDNELRINSAIALLEQKDPLCLPVIKDLITLDTGAFYLQAVPSPGRAFTSIKLLPLAGLNKQMIAPAQGGTAQMQAGLFAKCIDLPREKFMHVVDDIFRMKRNSLVPVAISLLENFNDEASIAYLLKKSSTPGAPFIRTSCHLSLWKSTHKEIHKTAINSWLKKYGKHEMITVSQKKSSKNNDEYSLTGYELSLEEKSHLLIGSFLNLAASREKCGLDSILDAMIDGHEKNRIPLAGVLLKTIQ